MDLPTVPIPHDWAERILTLILGLLGGGTAYKILTLIVNKQKRKADVAIGTAEAENKKVDAFAKWQNMVMSLQDRLNHVEATSDERERNCQAQIRFLQNSLTYNRQMLSAYTRRQHAFAHQSGDLSLFIANQNTALATAAEKLKGLQSSVELPDGMVTVLTELVILIQPTEFRIKTAEEITRAIPLPTPPDGVEAYEDDRSLGYE